MIAIKLKVKILTLALVSQENYKWHAYTIKNYIQEKFQINRDVIYPEIRKMQENGLLESKLVKSQINNRVQKKFKITNKGNLELKKFIYDLNLFLISINDLKEKN